MDFKETRDKNLELVFRIRDHIMINNIEVYRNLSMDGGSYYNVFRKPLKNLF